VWRDIGREERETEKDKKERGSERKKDLLQPYLEE
jgi:hypothetical protein